jgi:hypothetical protein
MNTMADGRYAGSCGARWPEFFREINNIPVDCIYASQQDVADLANVARTTAWKILKEFENRSIVGLEYGRILIRSKADLITVLED